jgi:hypothetical protein
MLILGGEYASQKRRDTKKIKEIFRATGADNNLR